MGAQVYGAGPAGRPPLVLRASAYFWLAGALVSGVAPVLVMASRPPDVVLFAVGVGLVLLVTAFQTWAALRLLRGERWARLVLTALAAMSLFSAPGAVSSGLLVTGLVLILAGAVLMWLPPSSAYLVRVRTASAR